jgi:hypothetical protein
LHPRDRPTFVNWTKTGDTIDRNVYNNYIIGLIPRWEDQFGESSIDVYNMHDLPETAGGITGAFFCHAVPNANHTCHNLQRMISKHGGNEEHANPSKAIEYEDLAYAAYELGLVQKSKYDFPTLTKLVYTHQEKTLHLGPHDFDPKYKECLDDDTLHRLLEITLYTEELYFPEFYKKTGEDEIKKRFEKHKSTMLCSYHALDFLKNNQEWQNFFKQLT